MPFAFGIRNIETKEIWRGRRGKTSWRAAGHAKNAWNCVYGKTFDSSNGGRYEVFRYGVDEAAELAEAVVLLQRVIHSGALTFDSQPDFEELEGDICEFLRKD